MREIDIIYMDFKKAVSHSRLLTKLKSIGITGKLCLWHEAYPSDCYQATQFPSFVMYYQVFHEGAF